MSREKIVAFLPCRKGSERVVNKNVRDFAGIEGGLTTIKLDQLLETGLIDEIVVSTDDPVVRDLAASKTSRSAKPIRVLERAPELASSQTSTDQLIRHVGEIILDGAVLWTHVTNPFVSAVTYDESIELYHQGVAQGDADSLMSVDVLQKFIWDGNGPINYDRNEEKWPRTQTIPELYEVNSAIFICSSDTYRKSGDRVGGSPIKYPMHFPQSIDIDTMVEFELAEKLWAAGTR